VTTPDDPTTNGLPAGDAGGEAQSDIVTPLTASPLTESDDAFVLGLLMADQASDRLPADVAARWDAAISTESADRAAQVAGAAPLAHLPSHRAEPAPRRRLRLAGAAASVAAIALVGGIVANSVLAKDPVGSTPDTVTAAASPLPLATLVSTSGLSYQPTGILSQVGALLKGSGFSRTLPPETPAASEITALPQTGDNATATPDPTSVERSTSDTAVPKATSAPSLAKLNADPAVVTFRTSEKLRAECLQELNAGPGARPVLLDIGYYKTKPAALIVLPTIDDVQRLDVWIVGPACHKGDAYVLWFGRVDRP